MFGYSLNLLSLVSKKTPTKDRKLDIDDIQNDPINFNMENFRLKLESIDRQLETYQDVMRKGKAENFEMMDKALTVLSQKANRTPTDLFLERHMPKEEEAGDTDEEERLKRVKI
jgi:hypothetical protein